MANRIYRRICPLDLASLEGGAFKVHRDVYNWLNAGPDSTMTSLRRVSVAQLCEQLGWSVANVKTALTDLHEMGLIVWSSDKSLAYGHGLTRDPPQNHSHKTAMSRELDRYISCAATSEARKIIDSSPYTVSRTVPVTVQDTTGIRSQESGNSSQVLTETAHNLEPFTKSQEPREQLSLSMPASKPAKEQKPMNETFAKAYKVAAMWNATMKDQPEAKADVRNMRVLAAALDLHGEESLQALLTWAHANEWHSGRMGSKAIGVWMARDKLATCAKDFENASSGRSGKSHRAPVGNAPDAPVGRDDTLRFLALYGEPDEN